MSEEKKAGWGGARKGAGRKPTSLEGVPRKQKQTRATDAEWEIIKEFIRIVRTDRARALRILQTK